MSRRSGWLVVAIMLALSLPVGAQELKSMEVPVSRKAPKEEPAPAEPTAADHLKLLVGTWRAEARLFVGEGEPVQSKGVVINSLVLGDTFLKSEYKGDMDGRSILGLGLDGYDAASGTATATWADNMDPAIYFFEGTCEDLCRTKTLYSERTDAESGKIRTTKTVTKIHSNSMYTYEAWDKLGDGEYRPTMQIRFNKL